MVNHLLAAFTPAHVHYPLASTALTVMRAKLVCLCRQYRLFEPGKQKCCHHYSFVRKATTIKQKLPFSLKNALRIAVFLTHTTTAQTPGSWFVPEPKCLSRLLATRNQEHRCFGYPLWMAGSFPRAARNSWRLIWDQDDGICVRLYLLTLLHVHLGSIFCCTIADLLLQVGRSWPTCRSELILLALCTDSNRVAGVLRDIANDF